MELTPAFGIHVMRPARKMMDANSGEPWSEMDVSDLTRSLDYGNTFAQAARFLCRDEDEVRQKARQLGLVEHPGKRLKVVR
jgi:hypothetical protein